MSRFLSLSHVIAGNEVGNFLDFGIVWVTNYLREGVNGQVER